MLDCKDCKYYIGFCECRVIRKIYSEYTSDLITFCPFAGGKNKFMKYILDNIGDLYMILKKIGESYCAIMKLELRKPYLDANIIATVESDLFSNVEDALTNALFKLYEQIEREFICKG